MADDGSGGTPVTLVVPPASVTPGTVSPPPARHPLPFTGFDLVAVLLLGAVLVAVGTVLLTTTRSRRT